MNLQIWNKTVPYLIEDADTPNSFDTYFIDTDQPLPCIVVLPGGGYHDRARHEGEPIARFFNTQGFHAVVVNYRIAPNRFPSGLADAQRTIRILRHNAKEWMIDPQRIVTCGFSAGGHLCASTVLYPSIYDNNVETDAIDAHSPTPNGAILCYPVISMDAEYGHIGSGKHLLGEERYPIDKDDFFLAPKITESTPKVFLWHTSDDSCVNVKNSLIFAERLRDCNIPFELHVFPHGRHGLGLANASPDACQWKILAADWVKRNI